MWISVGRHCKWGLLALASTLAGGATTFGGGVVVVGTVVTDNGDNDSYADTQETVTLRLVVRNTSGQDLTGLTARLTTTVGAVACLTRPVISIGDLSAGEERTTDEGFEFVVPPGVERTSADQDLSVRFNLTVRSSDLGSVNTTPRIDVDLDLDVSGGGIPTTYFESFEGGFGSFTTMHLDESLNPPESDLNNRPAGVLNADGWRCQYSDPEWEGSASYGSPSGTVCYPNATGAQDAFYFGIATDRAFSGMQALRWNILLDGALGYTHPTAQVEAVCTIDPVNLAWGSVCSATRTLVCADSLECPPAETCVPVSPRLTIRHQVSNVDHRSANVQPDRTFDRSIVAAQKADAAGEPIGPWIKLYPFVNVYDSQANSNTFGCTFDPADDGNDEGDFFDPTDPLRTQGPSSTCAPEFSFSHQGDTDAPFDPLEIGDAEGPGLQGDHGIGTWVVPEFNLDRFRGQRLRLRFLTAGYKVSGIVSYEQVLGYNPHPGDDGWFIDDVLVTDAITDPPATVTPDIADNSTLPLEIDADFDLDGVFDVCDTCPTLANGPQTDADDDGIGDGCDPCPSDPLNDADGDSRCAPDDNCREVSNVDQSDVDGDLTGDRCDTCPLLYNPTQDGDQDGDGVDCLLDTCQASYNPDQLDLDGDGLGDACDACPEDLVADADLDGLCGGLDSCPFHPSTAQGSAVNLSPPTMNQLSLTPDESRIVVSGDGGLHSMAAAAGDRVVLDSRRITRHAIAPDGANVVFLARDLFSVPIDGGDVLLLGTPDSPGFFGITPDVSHVVYGAGTELFSVPVHGGPAVALSPPWVPGESTQLSYRIGPGGTHVLMWRGVSGPDLFVTPIDGGPAVELSAPLNFTALHDAQFTPDGSQVVFRAAAVLNGPAELYRVPVDGSAAPQEIRPPEIAGNVESFKLSPDGHWVFYLATQESVKELFRIPLFGGTPNKVNAPLSAPSNVQAFAVDPSGAYVAYRIPAGSLFVVPVDGGTAEPFGSVLSLDDAAFTPDGARLVYRTTAAELFSRPTTGGAAAALNDGVLDVDSFGVAGNGSTVTYLAGTPARLFSVPIAGGPTVEVSDGLTVSTAASANGVMAQSHDGSVTYWASGSGLYASWLEPDLDLDGVHRACDCDEDFPGALEINDGLDNQCPGADGYGLVDELPGPAGFSDAYDSTYFAWAPQSGATGYEVVRASDPRFATDCACTVVLSVGLSITEEPPPGGTYFYLSRALAPKVGSAGADSSGNERDGACLQATCGGQDP